MNPIEMIKKLMGNNTNPMINNLISMAQQGNTQGVEQFARNICKDRGIDYDTDFPRFMSQFNKR